jgi:Protein of unknown function (DUF2970)
MKAVLWSFLGIRRGTDMDADTAQLKPGAVIAAAFIACAGFVAGLMTLVHFVAKP